MQPVSDLQVKSQPEPVGFFVFWSDRGISGHKTTAAKLAKAAQLLGVLHAVEFHLDPYIICLQLARVLNDHSNDQGGCRLHAE